MQRVFNFSGGRTSAYMVLKYHRPGDLIIFTDTGREHPKTYKFINDFEAFENLEIIRIKYKDAENPFRQLLSEKKYKVIPNRVKRICTVELKINTCKRYLRHRGIQTFENFIGFRADEPLRVKRNKPRFKKVINKFPLFDDNITKPQILDFWSKKPYDLEIPAILGNCTLCFMKGTNAIMAILASYPELANEWIIDEETAAKLGGKGRTYFPGITIKQLRDIAQNNLFSNYALEDIKPAYNCECSP